MSGSFQRVDTPSTPTSLTFNTTRSHRKLLVSPRVERKMEDGGDKGDIVDVSITFGCCVHLFSPRSQRLLWQPDHG